MLAHAQLLARTDGLTGLYNFRYFFELASYEFTAAIRYKRPLSIIIFDTDKLKQVNLLESLPYEAPEEIVPEEIEVEGETSVDDQSDEDIQLDDDGQITLF